jgi:hypothetical protein
MQHTATVPPVTLGTNGHLPAIVAQAEGARPHPKHSDLLTAAQCTFTLDEGLAAHRTTPIESAMRDIDSEAERRELPWLAAEIVVLDDKPQAYGRKTMVWLHNGRTTGELTPAQAREALVAMREFADRYEALLDLADATAAGDFEGDPEIARLDREAEDRRVRALDDSRIRALFEGRA